MLRPPNLPVGHEGKKAAESKTLFVVAIGCFFIQITLFSVLVWYWIKENEWEKVAKMIPAAISHKVFNGGR